MLRTSFYGFFLLFFLIFTSIGFAQNTKYTLKGNISDAQTGENLMGAAVWVKQLQQGCVSNENGSYTLQIPSGEYDIEISFIGYPKQSKKLKIEKNTQLNFKLEPEAQSIEGVVVKADRQPQVERNQMGTMQMSIQSIREMPSFLGEVDIIKAMQLLPGVLMASEGSAGFSVRGGSPDQNYILLDEATVYNPSHAMGFFSVFNNDAISKATVYKGDIPVRYGGRLSSVIDVEMKEGDMQKWGFGGGIGLLSSRLFVEGPLWKGKTSVALAGRRTYFDIFLPLAPQPEVKDVKLYFYDANLKIAHTFNEKNRLFISGYMGQDVFGTDNDVYMRMNYGNKALSVKWNHIFSDKLSLNTSFILSDYRYNMGMQDNELKMDWKSKLTDYGGRLDFTYLLNAQNTLKFGVTSYYHIYQPGDMLMDLVGMSFLDTAKTMTMTLDPYHALENGIYIGNDQQIGEKLSLKYGIRLSSFSNIGPDSVWYYDDAFQMLDAKYFGSGVFYNTYFGFEPRIGASYMFTPSISVKANYSRTLQYSQLAQNSTAGNPLDVWFPANPIVKPQIANQYALGYFQSFKNNAYEASVEFYYKGMKNVIDFKDHSEIMMNDKLYGEIRIGKGRAYGMEIMLQKHEGMFTGWISYTLSKAERTIADVNNGKTYLAPYDRPHAVNVVLNAKLHPRHSVAANWVYYTGNPATFPSGKAVIDGVYVPVYTDRNSYRMPDYHRLDVSYTLRSKPNLKKRFSWDLVFACYNVYGRKNPWSINFKQDREQPQFSYAEMTYLFSAVPSVTFNFKF